MVGKVKKRVSSSKKSSSDNIKSKINRLSEQELKESLLIANYKIALLRAQIESLTRILVKHKLTTYEEVWSETNKNIKDNK